MADFFQGGAITTLHRLGDSDPERLEAELLEYGRSRPIALVLPCLQSEIHGPGLKGIVDILRGVRYLRQIVVSVSGTSDPSEYTAMRAFFEGVETTTGEPPTLLWNSGPRLQSLYGRLRDEGLDLGQGGKGLATWLGFGYVLAVDEARVIAVHDCDIRTYNRELLARLCYPTVNPNLDYEFAKGYYGRVADRLYGRVTRLFVTPLLRAMKSVLGQHPLLDYLDVFRYPLAGEVSMATDLARINRIPSDWGLELTDNYDHRHQDLSEDDSGAGLHRMVVDIASSAIRNLASYGVEFDAGFLNTLTAAYRRLAQDAIASYSDDAALNGLVFDRHEEERAVETFTRGLRAAGLGFVRDPLGVPQIPNWSRVIAAAPDFLGELRDAVNEDAQRILAG
jgi:glucosyl-3-phosphoglycerate synthase